MDQLNYFLTDEKHTEALGAQLAQLVTPPCVIYLQGHLGAGKTTFVRGFLQALGYVGNVKSPTYTLVEPYILDSLTIFHFDLYRLRDAEELEFLGIRDYFKDNTLALIEWPTHVDVGLPPADLTVTLAMQAAGRSATLTAHTEKMNALLTKIKFM